MYCSIDLISIAIKPPILSETMYTFNKYCPPSIFYLNTPIVENSSLKICLRVIFKPNRLVNRFLLKF